MKIDWKILKEGGTSDKIARLLVKFKYTNWNNSAMIDKKAEKKKEPFDYKNPYNLWGLALILVGVLFGGGLGGLAGGIGGIAIMQIGRKDMSNPKKIGVCALVMIGTVFAYFMLASMVLSLFSQK